MIYRAKFKKLSNIYATIYMVSFQAWSHIHKFIYTCTIAIIHHNFMTQL